MKKPVSRAADANTNTEIDDDNSATWISHAKFDLEFPNITGMQLNIYLSATLLSLTSSLSPILSFIISSGFYIFFSLLSSFIYLTFSISISLSLSSVLSISFSLTCTISFSYLSQCATYSVIQSDGSTFWGDVVSDVRIIMMIITIRYTIYENAYYHYSSTKTQFYELLFVIVLYFFIYAFSSITLKIYNLHNKYPKRFAFLLFV